MDYNIHIPVGFKFHPTEEELISHYLKPKLEGDDINIIPEIELSNVEPCDIPDRQTRMAADSVVNETGTNNVIGYKKILAFYEGRRNRKNETIINWVMYEYHAAATSEYAHQRSFVLCHLMKNADRKTQWGTGALTCDKGETSRRAISDCKNKPVEEGIPNVHGLLPEVNTDSIVPTWHQEQSYNANPRNENSSRQTPFEYTEGIKDVGKRIFLILDYIPKGFRFRPREEELVSHYLKRKLEGDDASVINIIPEIELCCVEPSDIPARCLIKTNGREWFFFSPLHYMNAGKSKRVKRETERGFWRITGNDTVIMETGTNNVIGTRKALHFHEGRRKNETITIWAMHEYHAAATSDHAHQRNFVLCRLMNTEEKKTQQGTGALICDKGEPSRHKASDCKNKAAEEGIPDVHGLLPEVNTDSIVPTWHQEQSYNSNSRNVNSSSQTPFVYTEGITDAFGSFPEMNEESILQIMDQKVCPSIQQSRDIFDEEVFLPKLPSHNANFRNENSSRQAPVEITEEEDEYLNSDVPDGKFVFTEKRRNAFVKCSTRPSLRRVYYESSDTDAEVVSALCFNIVDTSTVRDEHPSSGEYHASKMYKSSHGVKASSCDSTADEALKINCIGNSGSLSQRRWKYQYHTKPFISQRSAARYQYQPQRKLSGNAVSNLEARKPSSCTRKMKKPEKDHVIARNSSSRKNSETRNHQSSNVNREGSFICQETASSSPSLFLLLANIVLGILFFMLCTVICLELLSY